VGASGKSGTLWGAGILYCKRHLTLSSTSPLALMGFLGLFTPCFPRSALRNIWLGGDTPSKARGAPAPLRKRQ